MLRPVITGIALVLFAGAAGAQTSLAEAPRARPGDRVVLKIWDVPEAGSTSWAAMSDTFLVAQNGHVVLPKPLGATQADGAIIAELENSIRSAYIEYLRNPSVEVYILRRISVLGEVREPGTYLADLTVGVPEIIARAGGATENGDARRITVLRGSQRLRLRGDSEEAFAAELHSGDQVIIGRKNFFVRNPWASISTAFTLITFSKQLGLW